MGKLKGEPSIPRRCCSTRGETALSFAPEILPAFGPPAAMTRKSWSCCCGRAAMRNLKRGSWRLGINKLRPGVFARKALNHDDPVVRRQAIFAPRFGQEYVPALNRMLDEDWNIRFGRRMPWCESRRITCHFAIIIGPAPRTIRKRAGGWMLAGHAAGEPCRLPERGSRKDR